MPGILEPQAAAMDTRAAVRAPAAAWQADEAGERRRRRLVLYLHLGLTLLTLAAYLPALRNGFIIFDDRQYVTENPIVQAGLTLEGLRWALTDTQRANWHPLTLLSHMLDCELFGLNPKGHHLTSLLLHLAGVLLLFEVLRRMTGAALRSAAVAALFAVHPTHVESVAWVAERKDVLCGVFWMLTLAAYLRYARRPSPARYLLVVLGMALALAAKPMAVTLPLALLILDFWPLRRLSPPPAEPGTAAGGGQAKAEPAASQPAGIRRAALPLLLEKLPLLALSAAAGIVALHTQAVPLASGASAPLSLRAANASTSYVAYLGKTLYPAHLAVFYPFPAEVAAWKVVAAAALLLALTLAALAAARRAPYLAVGWLWYLGTLLPVAGVLQVGMQGMADRYTYLPSIGLYLAAVWGIADLAARRRALRPWLAAAAFLGLALLVRMTRTQVGYWVDSMTLFSHSLEVQQSYLAHTNVAEDLRSRQDRRGAFAHYRAALVLEPRNPRAYAAMGNALRSWGRDAAALPYLRKALALDPEDEGARITLAMADDDLGHPDAALAELSRVVAANPGSAKAHYGLGTLLLRRGDREQGLLHYQKALAADPALVELYSPVAAQLAARGELAGAAALLTRALALRPRSPALHTQLAVLLDHLGEPAKARAHRREAALLTPPSR
ncbi:MAG TPA: tetratricopeptide repeat protein [Thermoanaerobaculia bacterium]|nr:tetratricopeptide repeat protein [Thermoanaerobaculia bacterium]